MTLPTPTYTFGDVVYLKIADEPRPGVVTGIITFNPGNVVYSVTWPGAVSGHYDFELTGEYVPNYGPVNDDDVNAKGPA